MATRYANATSTLHCAVNRTVAEGNSPFCIAYSDTRSCPPQILMLISMATNPRLVSERC